MRFRRSLEGSPLVYEASAGALIGAPDAPAAGSSQGRQDVEQPDILSRQLTIAVLGEQRDL